MRYELSTNYVPLSPLPLKVGGHVPPAAMGAPPMCIKNFVYYQSLLTTEIDKYADCGTVLVL